MDFLKKIFGTYHKDDEPSQYPRNNERYDFPADSDREDLFDRKGFEVFSDPLHMHQYFEHQMNEILKSFGFQEFGQSSMFDTPNLPALDVPFGNESNPENLRDQFLKPGYVKAKSTSDMVDKDLDDKVKSGDLKTLLNEKHDDQDQVITPHNPHKFRNFSFSHESQSTQFFTKPDGSVETRRTVRDSQGNEETTVCHKIGNKEYCVIKKKDKHGNEESSEQFVNMTEDEKGIFFRPKNVDPHTKNPNSDIPWEKFFK